MSSLPLKLMGLGLAGGGAVIGGSVYLLKSTTKNKTNRDYLIEKGYLITEENDPIGTKAFALYDSTIRAEITAGANAEVAKKLPTTLPDLKKQCNVYLSYEFKDAIGHPNFGESPISFLKTLCIGKTGLGDLIKGDVEGVKKLNVDGDQEKGEHNANNTLEAKLLADPLKPSPTAVSVEEVKNFCRDIDGNMTVFEATEKRLQIRIAACTDASGKPGSKTKEE